MSTSNTLRTHETRRAILAARRQLDSAYCRAASKKIIERFIRSREFLAARNIACYWPMADEVDTRAVFARAWNSHKRIYGPVLGSAGEMSFVEIVRDSTLEKNKFGVWEPTDGFEIEPRLLDIVITPLVAFDDHGHRIGMGAGYYDRAFAFLRHRQIWLQPKLIGLAFDCQKVEKILPNPWDIPLYRVYTERE